MSNNDYMLIGVSEDIKIDAFIESSKKADSISILDTDYVDGIHVSNPSGMDINEFVKRIRSSFLKILRFSTVDGRFVATCCIGESGEDNYSQTKATVSMPEGKAKDIIKKAKMLDNGTLNYMNGNK